MRELQGRDSMKTPIIGLILTLIAGWPTMSFSQQAIRIGGIFSLSGSAASGGVPEMYGATLAVEEINRREIQRSERLEFVVENNHSTAAGTALAVRKLAQLDKVQGIIGLGGSPAAHSNATIFTTTACRFPPTARTLSSPPTRIIFRQFSHQP